MLSAPLDVLGAETARRRRSKGEHGAKVNPGAGPAKLWMTPPSKRKVDVSGFFSPEDTMIAMGRGMAPGTGTRLDERATIRGGIEMLKALGVSPYTRVDTKKLLSLTTQQTTDDVNLIRAAYGKPPLNKRNIKQAKKGKAHTLTQAAEHIRRVVHRHHLDRAAWGARSLYVYANLKGFFLARTVVATASQFFPGIGTIVGAAIGGHGAISAAVAKKLTEEATTDVKEGLATARAYQRKQATRQRAGPPESSAAEEAGSEAPAPPSALPDWWKPWMTWAGLGLGGTLVVTLARRSPS